LRPIVRLAAIYHAPPAARVEAAADPLARDPVVGPASAPGYSVLLITIDALRADHVGTYGYVRPTTPNLDELATEGVVFEHAYTSAPQTSFAIASIMTGTHFRAVRAAPPTWAEHFGRAGYATAAFYPEPVFFTERPRFAALEARHLGFERAVVDWGTADARAFQVSSFVNDLPRDRPFFAWAHLFEPHEPHDARAEYPFGGDDVARYDSEIAFADRGVGTLVRLVRARRPQTIVIITADHGEAFGEHASRYHGTTLYEEQTHVPLVIIAPELFQPTRIARPVQTIDLLPTIARTVGVALDGPLRGRDLFASGEGVAFASLAEQSMLAVGNDRLICQTSIGTCTLFDLGSDPTQNDPLVSGPRIDALRASLVAAHAGNAAASH
jgi:membrane-anchored protein YejM (alkaline phosphatase superfamily)